MTVSKMKFRGGPLDGQELEVAEGEFAPIYYYAVKRTPLCARYELAASANDVYEMHLHSYTSVSGNLYPDFHTVFGISIDEATAFLLKATIDRKTFRVIFEILTNLKSNPKALALLGGFDNLEAQRMIAEAEA